MCLYLCRETCADKVFIMDCMTVLLSIFQTMKSRSHHAVLAGWMFSTAQAFAGTYPLGDMTCPEIGQFASQAMQWREDSGTPCVSIVKPVVDAHLRRVSLKRVIRQM